MDRIDVLGFWGLASVQVRCFGFLGLASGRDRCLNIWQGYLNRLDVATALLYREFSKPKMLKTIKIKWGEYGVNK